MTIAVGFNCKDGVVIAADSEICLGPAGKKYVTKFCELRISDSVFLIGAGNLNRTEAIAEALRKAIWRKTGKELTKVIQAACQSFWRSEGVVRAETRESFRDLLITVNAGSGALLFRAGDGHFTKVRTYSVVGMESERAAAIFSRFYRRGVDAKVAAYMGIYCLSQLKGFVPGCGGKTRVWTITKSPFQKQHFSDAEIERAEKAYRFFEQELGQLLFAFPDHRIGKEEFQGHQRRFSSTIQRLRTAPLEEDPSEKSGRTTQSRGPAKKFSGLAMPKSILRFKSPTALENAIGSVDSTEWTDEPQLAGQSQAKH